MIKAASKLQAEVGEEIEINNSPNTPFKLLWENIKHENEWVRLKEQKSLEMMKGEVTLDEYEEFVDKEGKKHRAEKGYLQSEVPLQFVSRTQMIGLPPPELLYDVSLIAVEFLIEEVKKLGNTIDSDKYSWEEVVKFLGYWTAVRMVVIKALGRKNANKMVKSEKFCKKVAP